MAITTDNCEKSICYEELKEGQIADLIQKLTPIQLLNICKDSQAPAEDIYHFWIEKIFKLCEAYILKIQLNDWRQITDYFQTLLSFVTNEDDPTNEKPVEVLDKWCLCTFELVKWMERNFAELDLYPMGFLIDFVLSHIGRFLEAKTSKSHAITIGSTQEKLIQLISNYFERQCPINGGSTRLLMEVVSKLCDVGVQLSQSGIKIAMETWRIVGKLSITGFTWSQIINSKKLAKEHYSVYVWSKKPVICLFNEFYKLLNCIQKRRDVISANENFFKLMQFYLKLIKIIINFCQCEDFPAAKQFFNCYLLYNSLLKDNIALQENFNKIDINGTLQEVFEMIYSKNEIIMFLTTYCCLNETDSNVFMYYLAICLKQHQRNEQFLTNNIQMFLKIFDKLFENSYIYVTNKEYNTCLTYFVILLLLDSSSYVHKHLCVQVIEAKWIASHTSADILRIYYSFYYKHANLEMMWSLIEFWCNTLEQYASSTYNKRKVLIHYILESLIENIPVNAVQRLTNTLADYGRNAKQFHNISQEKSISESFLQTLTDNLHKLERLCISQDDYFELLNGLEILYHKSNSISNTNDILMKLIEAFITLLSKYDGNICDLQLFFNNCFLLFDKLKRRQNHDELILNCLNDNADRAEAIYSVFMLDCLLHYLPQSRNILQKLKMPPEFHKVKFLLQMPSSNIKTDNQQVDLQIFRKLDGVNNSHSSSNL